VWFASPVWSEPPRTRRRQKTCSSCLNSNFQTAKLQSHLPQTGSRFGSLKASSHPLQLPLSAKEHPFERQADYVAPIARDVPAAKLVGRRSNARAASVRGHPPVHQLTDNGRVGPVPSISSRFFPSRDPAPAPECAVWARAFQPPAE